MVERILHRSFWMSDELFARIDPLLPTFRKSKKGGRPRMSWRAVLDGIFYVLRTCYQRKALPPEVGSGSTVHSYFQFLVKRRTFTKLWQVRLEEYDELKGIDWKWQSMDGSMSKTPLGWAKTGRNRSDRGKQGTKWSGLTDGNGIPLAAAVDGANTHDMRLVDETLKSIPIERPDPNDVEKNMCLEQGYDYDDVRQTIDQYGYNARIKSRGDEEQERKQLPTYRARRWVVERTYSWMNRFRRLLIRWEKKVKNYRQLLHLACVCITLNAVEVFG